MSDDNAIPCPWCGQRHYDEGHLRAYQRWFDGLRKADRMEMQRLAASHEQHLRSLGPNHNAPGYYEPDADVPAAVLRHQIEQRRQGRPVSMSIHVEDTGECLWRRGQ